MKRRSPWLFFRNVSAFFTLPALIVGSRCEAQCGYPVTLHTNKDYCVGSSLIVESPHALQKIVWYKNGQPVATATGSQSWDTAGKSLPVAPGLGSSISDMASDAAGDLYLMYDFEVLKYTPGGGYGVTVLGSSSFSLGDWESMVLDQQGNIYLLLVAGPAFPDSALVREYFAGSQPSPGPADSAGVIGHFPTIATAYGTAGSLFMDCQKNIYVYFSTHQLVVKWPAGSDNGMIVAGNNNVFNPSCTPIGAFGRVRVDNQGNIFYIVGNGVTEMAVGAFGPVAITENGCSGYNATRSVTDFWLDAHDTIYQCGYDKNADAVYVDKWAPGVSTGQTILSHLPVGLSTGRITMNMDIKGDIFLGFVNSNSILEFKRQSSIDSAYTPADTGAYYALVTDIQGYTSVSDTFRINSPTAGPPSIEISASATSTPVCTPITFMANVTDAGYDPSYQWVVSGVPAGGDSAVYTYNLFANGDRVYCILHAQAGCAGPVSDTSNVIGLDIDPHGAASVTIGTSKDTICQGDTATFNATVINGSSHPVFEWLINGMSTGDDSSSYTSDRFSNGDVVTCLITSDDVCGLAKSNSIPVSVSVPPKVLGGQIYTIITGHSVTLAPVITGDVAAYTYAWSPVIGLSDPAIADPVAGPTSNTLYTLKVTAPGGCSDTGSVFVNVYTPISVPGAFTPNGDGHNDIFYVLGGPVNSRVEEFAVYDRYGAVVFAVHGVAPGDARFGWNGKIGDSPAPAGTYVYLVVMQFANGSRQLYKGTVILVR